MGKPKQLLRPPKKQKAKSATPETEEEFLKAADFEEETAGKWRKGDSAKAGRACVRALEIYQTALERYPSSFDLAYNKARLELEITQQPPLVSHIGVPIVDLLRQTLNSHRYALRLNEENPDILFNTSQVLKSLAEQLSEAGDTGSAAPLLQEALELLSACLSRQEMLLEQQQADFEDAEDGGVLLDPEERLASTSGSDEAEQMATIETPVTPSDLLDTVQASLSALTHLVSMTEQHSLQTLGDMAHSLTETKAPGYIGMLPSDIQGTALFANALGRANFVAAFADAQYNAYLIEVNTYVDRLSAFAIPGKEQDTTALSSEAECRTELATSVLARFGGSPELPADICWQQLKLAQQLYTQATKIDNSAQLYLSRGDVEMLRHRISIVLNVKLSDAIRKSAPTLVQNAQTYYKGAVKLAGDDEVEIKLKAQQSIVIATHVRTMLYDVPPSTDIVDLVNTAPGLDRAVVDFVDEGILDVQLAEAIMARIGMAARGN